MFGNYRLQIIKCISNNNMICLKQMSLNNKGAFIPEICYVAMP